MKDRRCYWPGKFNKTMLIILRDFPVTKDTDTQILNKIINGFIEKNVSEQ